MKYLTAEQLGVKPKERTALLKVKRFLKSLPRPKNIVSRYRHAVNEVVNEAQALFNMNRAIQPYDCGTAACIGGWMYVSMQDIPLRKRVSIPLKIAEAATIYVRSARPCGSIFDTKLGTLFYPQKITLYDLVTPQQAIAEIETFLKTGKATW